MKPRIVLIPAYNPPASLLNLAIEILKNTDLLIVVDDGSSSVYAPMFEMLSRTAGVHLIRHEINRGKGEALKTGFRHIMEHCPDAVGVVAADADGQHLPSDIEAVGNALQSDPTKLFIGSRSFKNVSAPWTNKFGNKLTIFLFKLFFGEWLPDTQSGLRGVPAFAFPELVRIKSSAYEFELDMLIFARQIGMRVQPVPITTVYKGKDTVSYFHPVIDSFRIYRILFRFPVIFMIAILADGFLQRKLISSGNTWPAAFIASKILIAALNYFTLTRYALPIRPGLKSTLPGYASVVSAWICISLALVVLVERMFGIDYESAFNVSQWITFVPLYLLLRDYAFRLNSTSCS